MLFSFLVIPCLISSTVGFTLPPRRTIGNGIRRPMHATKRIPTTTVCQATQFPSSVTVDLPSWLTESGNAVFGKLDTLSDLVTGMATSSNTNQQVLDTDQLSLVASVITPLLTSLQVDTSVIESIKTSLLSSSSGGLPLWHLEAILAFGIGNAFLFYINSPDKYDEAPYEPGTSTYDPEAAAEFYNQRPLLVAKRILKLGLLTGGFNTGILFDWLVLGKLFKDEEYTALKNAEPKRAKIALRLCEQLGPTFIKLGQALSIRTDLIPEAYALELRQLQDAVPPFSSDEAYEVLREQLGVTDLKEIFSSLSETPVASASIGQVYRGTLASNGKDVAVKVQRPGILGEIALDLHVLRILTPIQTIFQNAANGVKTTQEDIDTAITLVDEWGRGFVAETDYRLEAKNTMEFEEAMRKRNLDAVCAPTVVTDLVTDTVLVTEWVEGTRLDRDASPDVPRLCGVAINAYLTMLLDTGCLHCDPHPGNLLRTTDGKLCILDWGMTLSVPSDLQYALLELIAHINIEDYDSIPEDFINLGFSPEGVTAEKLQSSGITEGLTFAFRQLSAGGGPKKIQERVKQEFKERYGSNLSDTELREAARADMIQRMEEQLASEGVDVKGVTNIMEEMSKRNKELFQLPPYVLYVARAFSTLEGIGLSIDDNYSIIQECYPYLAQRLFTDRSPRAKRALRAMLGLSEEESLLVPAHKTKGASSSSALAVVQYGAQQGRDVPTRKANGLSPKKLMEMSDGFTSYNAATKEVDRDGAGQTAALAEFTKLLVDPKGSTLQDILIEETVKLGDASTRQLLRSIFIESALAKTTSSLLQTPKNVMNANAAKFLPGPIKAALIDRPAEVTQILEQIIALSEEDERVLETAKELRDVILARTTATTPPHNNGVTMDLSPQQQHNNGNNANLQSITSLLSDEETRKSVTEQLPGVAVLGRRIGAGLLRRAAYRTENTPFLPKETKQALIDANNALANVVDVKE